MAGPDPDFQHELMETELSNPKPDPKGLSKWTKDIPHFHSDLGRDETIQMIHAFHDLEVNEWLNVVDGTEVIDGEINVTEPEAPVIEVSSRRNRRGDRPKLSAFRLEEPSFFQARRFASAGGLLSLVDELKLFLQQDGPTRVYGKTRSETIVVLVPADRGVSFKELEINSTADEWEVWTDDSSSIKSLDTVITAIQNLSGSS